MKPLVSIVMPIYNVGYYLRDAINDILSQTYKNIELICVNDGSKDHSLDVIHFFSDSDKRIKIIDQENKGAAEARNTGIHVASGKYLMVLDADDRFEPEMIEKAVTEAEKFSADITIFDGFAFDNESSVVYEMKFLNRELIPNKDVFSYNDIPDSILQLSIEAPWNKLYRLDFIKDKGLYFLTSRYCNDVFFVMASMELADRVCVLRDKLIYYRTGNSASVTRGRRENPECLFEVLTNTLHKLKESERYEDIWKSYANYTWERLVTHVNEVVNENNYSIFVTRMTKDFIHDCMIDQLKESDLRWDEFYKDIRCLMDCGTMAFLFRVFRRNARYMLEREYGANSRSVVELNDEKAFFFDIGRLPSGSKIVLYGAGKRGKKLYHCNRITNRYEIVLWVDANPDGAEVNDRVVETPEKITEYLFDYVVVAVEDFQIVKEIISSLEKYASREKIIW